MSSRRAISLATLVFPEAVIPTNTTCRFSACTTIVNP
jgi:hypothetical protein